MRTASLPRTLAAAVLAALAVGFAGAADAADAAPHAAAKRPKKLPPLQVKKVVPRHGAKFVDLASEITITFNQPVDLATVTADTVVLRRLLETKSIGWNARLSTNGKSAILAPTQPLDPGADYELIVGTGVATTSGSALRKERRAIFYTEPRFDRFKLIKPEQFEDLEERMIEPRAAHSATLVAGGRVLLAGGQIDQYQLAAGAELFDPRTKSFSSAASLLRQPRAYHPAIEVGTGSAFLIGGWGGNGALSTVEYYDRIVGDLVPGPAMTTARDFHAAVKLADGRILVTGGLDYTTDGAQYVTTAEILDYDFRWRVTKGAPVRRRAGHTLSLLADGTVLVCGGTSSSSGVSPSGEIFDPVTETFRTIAFPPAEHRQLHTASVIDAGERVLFADGGNPIAEVYDPGTQRFYPAGGSSFPRRTRGTASVLPWGDVLITGGFEQKGANTTILASMDLYIRSAGDWGRIYYVDVVFSEPRAGHTATSLDDGRVLFAGGFTNDASLNSAVLFTPAPPVTAK